MHENQTAAVQSHLRKLRDSDTANKAFALKSLSFLVTQSKQQLQSCIESVAEELDEALSIEENEVDIAATDLLEQIITHYDKQQVYGIVKRKLLRQVVRNLGDHKMLLRKMSNKCLLEFIRKYHDYDSLLYTYLKEGLENNSQTLQLKQKCLNSLQSIVIHEFRFLDMNSLYTKRIFENIINLMTYEENTDLQKAAQQCLATLCRLKGIKILIGQLSKQYAARFNELRNSNKTIADALIESKKPAELADQKFSEQNYEGSQRNIITPLEKTSERPSLNRGFQNQYVLGSIRRKEHSEEKPSERVHRSISNEDIAEAEEMLKRIEMFKNDASFLEAIESYIPTLEINFNDRRTQLFTISVRIIQVILEIKICENRFYIRLVPSIVERLNDQKFLIRNCVNKMIKQYLKTYTKIWIENFFNSLRKALNANFKQDLISLLIYGYEMFYPIEYDRHEAVSVLAKTAQDKRKLIRTKAIECIILVLRDVDRTSYETILRGNIPADIFTMVIRRLQNSSTNLHSNSKQKSSKKSIIVEDPLEYTFKSRRPRLNTELTGTQDQSQDFSAQKKNYQSIKRSTNQRLATEEGSNRRHLKKVISLQQQYTANVFKLDELTALRDPINPEKNLLSDIKITVAQASPTRSIRMLSDGIEYIEKDKLQALSDPQKQMSCLLVRLRDKSWKTQFEAVNTTRSLIEYNQQLIVSNDLPETVEEILKGVLSLRSSIAKNSLMCLDELINKLRRRLDNHSDTIVQKVMKKTLYTNEFLQGEVRKCLSSIASNFSQSKLLSTLIHYRDHKSPNVKMNVLLILQNLIRNERVYRKECQAIWNILLPMIEEPSFELRDMARKNIQLIHELYPDYKTVLSKFMKKSDLERVTEFQRKSGNRTSKAIPALTYQSPQKHVLEEKVNLQLDEAAKKVEVSKVQRSYTSPKKYSTGSSGCTSEFIRLEEIEKGCRNFKDWKNRIACIVEIFKVAFKYARQFCDYSNSARYMTLLCEHIEDPNVRVSLNGLTVLQDALVMLKPLIEDHLLHILTRVLNGIASKKAEISARCQKVYEKLRDTMDQYKLVRDLLKLCQNPLQKTRIVAIKQLDDLLYTMSRQSLQSYGPSISKVLSKMSAEEKCLQVIEAMKSLTNSLAQLSEKR